MSATVIINNDRCKGEYKMFDLRSLDDKQAVLSGPLYLEVGEVLRLRVVRDEETVELEGTVYSIDDDTMTVRFAKS